MCHLQRKTTKQLIWKLGFVTRNHFLFYSSIRNAQQTMSNYERHTLDMEKFIVHKLRHQHAKLENCKNQFGHKFNFNANMRKLFNNSIRISTPEWAMEANLITRYNARYFSHFNYHVKFWRTNQAPGLSGVVKSVFQHSLFCCSLKAPQFLFFFSETRKAQDSRALSHIHHKL